MAALEVIQSNLIDFVAGPTTDTMDGTSREDSDSRPEPKRSPNVMKSASRKDKIGAAIVTFTLLAAFLGMAVFMVC